MLKPTDMDMTKNPLRPTSFDTMVGQEKLKPLLRRLVQATRTSGRPMDHLLLVGASGTGKTTLATIIARELGQRVFCLRAPIDMDTLNELRAIGRDGDVVFVDEIHMMVHGDRRGITQACDPESFYQLLEDGLLATPGGLVRFPAVTWIGATTDIGLLPEPLCNRFPLQPRLASYTVEEITKLGRETAGRMGVRLDAGVADLFAGAARGNPRQVNSYVRSARSLSPASVDLETAREVVEDLNSTTLDGLTGSMATMLRYLYLSCYRMTADGPVYKSSVNAIASACGHGRDTKAVALLVEPYLIQRGLVRVTPQGRALTDAGIARAMQLCHGELEPAVEARITPEPMSFGERIARLTSLIDETSALRAQVAALS